METLKALETALAELRRLRCEHAAELSRLDSAIGFLEKRVDALGGEQTHTTTDGISKASQEPQRRVGTARDVCVEILRERGPLTNRDLFNAALERGLSSKSPGSLYGSLAREKGKTFGKKSGKWVLIGE